ncbi:hypothetical protein [Persicitalea jodogahamensis]|uniref:Beta-propeller repeat protein n=1 Tax=Persicitalea jodogahamensis TaxID=402147 RepID=A0A8J3G9Y9_9BACT|nr:hypothetical protein [Persicitalea jodogahamensis]GHB70406.1 hypothetical protein GCM10007390_25070 [Persicitalea jodogahamensis]
MPGKLVAKNSRLSKIFVASDSLAWKVGDRGQIQATKIAIDERENVYVAGTYRDTVLFSENTFISKGKSDLFLAKYSPEGVLQWVRTAEGPESNSATDICTDAGGNIYLTGYLHGKVQFENEALQSEGTSDIFFAKYDTEGSLRWIRHIGGQGSDGGSGVAVNKDGDVYLTGTFTASVSFGGSTLAADGPEDAFIALYNSEGSLKWVRSGGGVGHDWGQSIAVDNEGNALMLGKFHKFARFGKVELSAPESEDLHSSNGFVLKCSPEGDFIWGQRMGGNRRNSLSSVVVDYRGDVFVSGSGYMKGTNASFGDTLIHSDEIFGSIIGKLSSEGVVQWVMSTIATGPYQDNMCADQEGDIYAHTSFDNTEQLKVSGRNNSQFFDSRGGADFVIAKFSSDGRLLKVRQEGGAGMESVGGMVLSKKGSLYILGSFDSPVTLAGTFLRSQGERSVFIMKILNK